MDFNRIKTILRNVDIKKQDSISLSFIQKKRNGYKCYEACIKEDVRDLIRKTYLEFLNTPGANLDQVEYNPNGFIEGKLEVAKLGVANIERILVEIGKEQNKEYDFKGLDIDKINFYCIKCKSGDEKIYFFRRFNKLKKLRNGIQGFFNDNYFVKVDKPVIGIDEQVDILIHDNEAAIFSRFALQTIFNLNDYFTQKTQEAMDILRTSNQILNFDQFERDCLNDRSATKRVTKIINEQNLINEFLECFSNLPRVITEAELSIELDASGMIDYRGSREERNHILSCMADRYYISLLRGKVGEDELR